MSLPTEREINIHNSLDEQSACQNFLGKDLEQAEALFRENALCYQEDLMWMGPAAFRYYVHAAIRYLQSAAATNDSDMINCFAGLLEFRLKYEASQLAPISAELTAVCAYITAHWQKFDMTPFGLYADLPDRYAKLQETISALQLSS